MLSRGAYQAWVAALRPTTLRLHVHDQKISLCPVIYPLMIQRFSFGILLYFANHVEVAVPVE